MRSPKNETQTRVLPHSKPKRKRTLPIEERISGYRVEGNTLLINISNDKDVWDVDLNDSSSVLFYLRIFRKVECLFNILTQAIFNADFPEKDFDRGMKLLRLYKRYNYF